MTLDEFIQREIDRGCIEDEDCFYIALDSLKLDNGTNIKVNDYAKYLDYELKKVVIQIHFHPMGGCKFYEVELKTEDKEEEEWHRQVMEEMTMQQLMEQEPELFKV